MKSLFFEFNFFESRGESFKISSKSKILSPGAGYADKYLGELLGELSVDGENVSIALKKGISGEIINKLGKAYEFNNEGYAVEISDKEINLYAESNRGFIYAVSTLKQLIISDAVSELLLYDRPDKELRGYKIYTPSADNIDAFKKIIDRLVYYKYNSIMIEVGGAMEYEKHPEINKKWKEFCDEVSVSPEATHKIQMGYPWAKNSIHADNGCGGYITKAQMRELVEYCREREIDVIPEVPSLSHSDYIVMAYPELNERAEDPYPDTYCPSNPKSYEILFDIIDEVIEVFEPEYINIGHDEFYTVGICDKCKDKDPVALYVNDIKKINDYLKTKGIKSIMWCEKILYKVAKYGDIYGLEGAWARPHYGIPDMGRAAGRIPKDVILMNWYWSLNSYDEKFNVVDLGYEDEKKLIDDGYEMIYGNFNGAMLTNYRKRISQIKGGFVSNWGSLEDEYMQRNRQEVDLTTTAYVFWSNTYNNEQKPILLDKAKREMQKRYNYLLGKNIIRIRHTSDFDKTHTSFYDGVFIIPEEWIIGNYVVSYSDGTKITLPVNFFYNIGCRKYGADSSMVHKLYGAGTPIEHNGETWYETAYTNPYPEKEINDIIYEPLMETKLDFEVIK